MQKISKRVDLNVETSLCCEFIISGWELSDIVQLAVIADLLSLLDLIHVDSQLLQHQELPWLNYHFKSFIPDPIIAQVEYLQLSKLIFGTDWLYTFLGDIVARNVQFLELYKKVLCGEQENNALVSYVAPGQVQLLDVLG